jgi:hypothetical protein
MPWLQGYRHRAVGWADMQPFSNRGPEPTGWSQPLIEHRGAPGGASAGSQEPGRSGPYWAGYAPKGAGQSEAAPGASQAPSEALSRPLSGLRNLSHQFRTNPAAQDALGRIFAAHDKASYFRAAGLGAALRHTVGLPQSAQHLRAWQERTRIPPITGVNPRSNVMRRTPRSPDAP